MPNSNSNQFEVVPMDADIGADITGCDLRNLDATQNQNIIDAIDAHLVLRFRDQNIDDAGQIAFQQIFGDLAPIPRVILGRPPWNADTPYLETISNVIESGAAIGSLGADELSWHSDVPYIDSPYGVCILRAIELPSNGGNTSFVSMYRVRDTLPDDLSAKLKSLMLMQSGARTRGGNVRDGPTAKIEAAHPIIQRHAGSGREYLFLGRRRDSRVLGLSDHDSENLLDRLWSHLQQTKDVCVQEWQEGDVIVWDNRYTMHRRDRFDPQARRILRRTSSVG